MKDRIEGAYDSLNKYDCTKVHLNNASLNLEIIQELCKLLINHPTIEHLDLSHNEIKDEGAIELSKMLIQQGSIRTLNLYGAHITDVGAAFIVETLKGEFNISLQELDLGGNPI